jgi:GDP-L-fucose synthase
MPSAAETSLIIGADGFLGCHFVRYFRERGWPTAQISRADGDLTDRALVERLFAGAPKATRIFHLVTRQRTGNIQYDMQGELLADNARIHLNVLDAWRLHQSQAKLVSTGSSCAFPELDRPIVETDFQAGPLHASVRGYGLAKQLLAVASETYASQYKLKYLHLILATVYGAGDHKKPDRTHFMTGMIDRAFREKQEGKSQFTVWGEPGTVRDLLYIDDQIEAILAADAVFDNRILNCASGAPVTIDEAARAVREALGWKAEITYPAGTFKGASYKSLDASIFLKGTGWRPRTGLVEGVREVLAKDYYGKSS